MEKFVTIVKKSDQKQNEKDKNDQPNNEYFPDFKTFVEGLGSWEKLLSTYTQTKKFSNLYQKIKDQYQKFTCYPPKEEIFNCFIQTPLDNIKVVIVGQDPYHQPGQAMGLCFSVRKKVRVPPSLKNIYKCIANDDNIKEFSIPNHGDLTNWANQGVLLLNTSLSVRDSEPNSHSRFGWLEFTNEVISIISKKLDGVIFLLWGKPAEKKKALIDTKKHHVLVSSHPSPFSANRGFLTCAHFSKVNDILKSQGKKEIDWTKINE